MSIRFWCARCGKAYLTAGDHAGKMVCCKACGHLQRVPTPTSSLAKEEMPAKIAPARPSVKKTQTPGRLKDLFRISARETSALQGVALCLVALSAADLFVTYHLLTRGGNFYESNPVAQWFFARWNIAGMAIYKFAIIGAVVAIGEVIERHRPGWGRGVILLGCVAAAVVIFHGLRLMMNGEP